MSLLPAESANVGLPARLATRRRARASRDMTSHNLPKHDLLIEATEALAFRYYRGFGERKKFPQIDADLLPNLTADDPTKDLGVTPLGGIRTALRDRSRIPTRDLRHGAAGAPRWAFSYRAKARPDTCRVCHQGHSLRVRS